MVGPVLINAFMCRGKWFEYCHTSYKHNSSIFIKLDFLCLVHVFKKNINYILGFCTRKTRTLNKAARKSKEKLIA